MLRCKIVSLSFMLLFFCSISANALLIYQVKTEASEYKYNTVEVENHTNDGIYTASSSVDVGTNVARSQADLAEGTLRVYAKSSTAVGEGSYNDSISDAEAYWMDTVIFDYTGEVTLKFNYEGNFTPLHPSYWDIRAQFGLHGHQEYITITHNENVTGGIYSGYAEATFQIEQGLEYLISNEMQIRTVWDHYWNGENTGSFNMEMADGGSFTSASGVLLSEASTPVPEPVTMLLFGTGVVGLAGVTRRKKRR